MILFDPHNGNGKKWRQGGLISIFQMKNLAFPFELELEARLLAQ
jgi:hypothetical protein